MSEFDNGDVNPSPGRPQRDRDVERSDAAIGWWWLWLCFFALFLFAGFGWWGWGPTGMNKPGAVAQVATQNELNQKVGQSITLHGQAVSMAGAHAFVIHNNGNDELGGKDVLVISKQPINTTVAKIDTNEKPADQALNVSMGDNSTYKVDGKVRMFNRDELQKETGADLKDIDAKTYENKAVIVADSVTATQPAR